jgi:ABC-type glycerol-3-phosphate transport system permease component
MKSQYTVFGLIRKGADIVVSHRITAYVFLIIVVVAFLAPFLWTLNTSLKSMEEVYRWPPTLIPQEISLEGYHIALVRSSIPIYLVNSLIYALSIVLFVATIGTLTTYGLSMYPFKGSTHLGVLFFAIRIIPPQALWLPFIILFTRIGLMNSRPAVIIFAIVLTYPLCVWMLKGLFDAFPRSLIDSATIDGASKIGVLLRVVVPIMTPGIAAISIIGFIWTWNLYPFPLLVLNTKEYMPITVGTHDLITDVGIVWNAISATEIFAIIPGVVLFIVAQRHIVSGLTAGAIKE